jgi:hypothetical protein
MNMTQKQAVHIACRYIVVFLLIAAVTEAIALPRAIVSLRYELQKSSILRSGMSPEPLLSVAYFLKDSILSLTSLVLRIALNLAGALWFYHGTPRLQRFFGLQEDLAPTPGNSPAP